MLRLRTTTASFRTNIPPPYEFDWVDAGVGPHPLLATATSDAGLTGTSAGIAVYVDRVADTSRRR